MFFLIVKLDWPKNVSCLGGGVGWCLFFGYETSKKCV